MGIPEHFRCYLQWPAARGALNHGVICLLGNLNGNLLCRCHSCGTFSAAVIYGRSREQCDAIRSGNNCLSRLLNTKDLFWSVLTLFWLVSICRAGERVTLYATVPPDALLILNSVYFSFKGRSRLPLAAPVALGILLEKVMEHKPCRGPSGQTSMEWEGGNQGLCNYWKGQV